MVQLGVATSLLLEGIHDRRAGSDRGARSGTKPVASEASSTSHNAALMVLDLLKQDCDCFRSPHEPTAGAEKPFSVSVAAGSTRSRARAIQSSTGTRPTSVATMGHPSPLEVGRARGGVMSRGRRGCELPKLQLKATRVGLLVTALALLAASSRRGRHCLSTCHQTPPSSQSPWDHLRSRPP